MTVKLSKDVWAKVAKAAAAGGYSSPDEEVVRSLKGPGYID
jgi:hypothetical protein